MVYNVLKRMVDQAFFNHCLICQKNTASDSPHLCPDCRQQLSPNTHCCRHCALPLPQNTPAQSTCGRCATRPPAFEYIIAPWLYEGTIKNLLLDFKIRGRLSAGRALCHLWWQARPALPLPRLLLPVPMHPHKLRKKGFSHTAELARNLSRLSGIPWQPHALHKIRDTPDQHRLNKQQRQHNLQKAFVLENGHALPNCLAIVDDVVTTASTVQTLARQLQEAGVHNIQVWALARTPESPAGY